ncbi:MAG: immunoglobulin domain-containing protein [Planctomycetes bacterium]|nr:immunoglobulin domain-containing protein [Planctomycetota bacterium]
MERRLNCLSIASLLFTFGNPANSTLGECPLEWRKGLGPVGVSTPVQRLTKWDSDGPGPEKEVLVVSGDLYTAGGEPCDEIVVWTGEYWKPLGSGYTSNLETTVWNNQLIAIGRFSTSQTTPSVVRWDGTNWQAMGLPIQGVSRAASFQGTLYCVREYTQEFIRYVQLMRWDGATWQDVGTPTNASAPRLLVAHLDRLFLVATFHDSQSISSYFSLRQWDGTNWSPVGDGEGINGVVSSIVSRDNDLVIAGDFSLPGEVDKVAVATWNGNTWTPWPDQPLSASALAIHNGVLVAGGAFGISPSGYTYHIAYWNGVNWQPTDDCWCGDVYALAEFDGELVVGGHCPFSNKCGQGFGHIGSWNDGSWRGLGASLGGFVYTFAEYKGSLVAGGSISSASGSLVNRVVSWDGRDWSSLGEGIDFTPSSDCMLVDNGKLVVGGGSDFEAPENGFLQEWDGKNWSPSHGGYGALVLALGHHNGDLILGGMSSSQILRWNGSGWSSFGGQAGYWAYAFEHYNGDLYAAGEFQNPPSVRVSALARWNGTSWTPIPGAMIGGGFAIAVHNEKLYVGGRFDFTGNNHLYSWDGNSWTPMGPITGGSTFSRVLALRSYRGNLYAGGEFTSIGGISANRIARWDGTSWNAVGAGTDATVRAITEYDGDLIVGGDFSTAGGNQSRRWARYGPAGPKPIIQTEPASPSVCSGSSVSLHTEAVGSGSLVYQWRKDGVNLQDTPAVWGTQSPTLVFAEVTPADSGQYECTVILDDCGRTRTNKSTLTVFATGSADGNADGLADGKDIPIFVKSLTDFAPVSQSLCAFDMNSDGILSLADLDPFVSRLLTSDK